MRILKVMGAFWKIVFIVGVLAVFLGPIKDALLGSALVMGVKAVAGVDVRLGSFSMDLIGQSVRIRDCRVYSPDGFPSDKPMADIPEISVQIDVPALFKRTLHVKYMRLNVREARIIKNEEGRLNVNSLKFAQQGEGVPADSDRKGASKTEEMKMYFDLVSLNVGKVVMEDYSGGTGDAKVSVYDVNLKEKEFRDMDGAPKLVAAVMLQALTPTGVQGIFSLGSKTAQGVTGVLSNTVGGLFRGIHNGQGN